MSIEASHAVFLVLACLGALASGSAVVWAIVDDRRDARSDREARR